MSDYRKYLDDSDTANEPAPMREIHAIRQMIREETRHMPAEEYVRHVNGNARKVIEELGLKVVSPRQKALA